MLPIFFYSLNQADVKENVLNDWESLKTTQLELKL